MIGMFCHDTGVVVALDVGVAPGRVGRGALVESAVVGVGSLTGVIVGSGRVGVNDVVGSPTGVGVAVGVAAVHAVSSVTRETNTIS
jgi:hypothetical protein